MKKYNRSQKLYIVEAAVEYLINILVVGAFLATLTKHLGISDELTGILSSVISLGCLFQLGSLFFQPKRKKPFVILFSVANQLLFSSLYLLPLLNINQTLKIALFVVAIILAYFLYNIAHPKKVVWLMSLVDDHQRGRFTADKEITSLWIGMLFSFSMGALSDYFIEHGQPRLAFIAFMAVMLALMLLHTALMIFTKEDLPKSSAAARPNILLAAKSVLSNKKMRCIMLTFMLYQIAIHAATPFYGTFLINDLGFSLMATTGMAMLGSIARILISKFWGKYADKYSFAKMFSLAMLLLGLAYLMIGFAVPKTAFVLFPLYYIFHGMAMGGTNSALVNLVFDYAELESRADSLAVCQAIAGLIGFLATLALSPIIGAIQNGGNMIFGMSIYAQQIVSLIASLFCILTFFFVKKAFIKK